MLGATPAFAAGPAVAEPLPELDCVIEPSEVADLGSGVPGVLEQVLVDRSDPVTAGQTLAALESGVEQASVDLAGARAAIGSEIELRWLNATFGKRQKERNEDLFQRKVISATDMDERETEAKVAQVQLRQAKENKELAALELRRAEEQLDRRSIRSPFDGVVMERFKGVGEYVEDQSVLRVARLDPLHVETIVPVGQWGRIVPGMRADVWVDAISDTRWTATVSRVDTVADAASGTFGVRLALSNPDRKVPAGVRCRMRFTGSRQAATGVPAAVREPGVGSAVISRAAK